MQIIQVDKTTAYLEPLTTTIGLFDGLHLAHVALIKECIALSKTNLTKSCVITFTGEANRLSNKTDSSALLSFPDKIKVLKNLGVDYVLLFQFDEAFQKITKEDFIKILLNLGIKALVVGFDFTYGYQGLGNIQTIEADSNHLLSVKIIPELEIDGEKIGTSLIRKYLNQGNILQANKLLGYNFYTNLNQYGQSENLDLIPSGNYETNLGIVTIQDGLAFKDLKMLTNHQIIIYKKCE